MGKATNPGAARQKRQTATKEQRQRGIIESVNGVDYNHGASPLTRWMVSGDIEDFEMAAISWCQRLWALVGLEQRTTASYDERTAVGTTDGESGAMMLKRADARDDLKRVSGGLGPDGEYHAGYIPKGYWEIFENCIRFDEPAGVMGSRLGRSAPSVRALMTVKLVAAFIAQQERLHY